MPETRRNFIKKALSLWAYPLAASIGLISKNSFADWPAERFARTELTETLHLLFADQPIEASKKIKLKLPRIAENGSTVPVRVSSTLEQVEIITLLVEKNPVPLVAQFRLFPGTDAIISARLKMAQTCDVIAVVQADGKLYSARKKVKVTIGGCGG